MTGISEVLQNASAAHDLDAAKVFSNVLNTDQHAMKVLKGTLIYAPDDAARVSRIMAEYAALATTKSLENSLDRTMQTRQPAARQTPPAPPVEASAV